MSPTLICPHAQIAILVLQQICTANLEISAICHDKCASVKQVCSKLTQASGVYGRTCHQACIANYSKKQSPVNTTQDRDSHYSAQEADALTIQ
ncbi:hypothetical protein AVEN_15090-1 [Araneus ventricosus]|uniref:Kazal-like domain-containing protein n=1 Tax=Araneus ventricosus TaxID=182803 RepID=A0A4Y2QFM0_ARAVE|nr:hypothetical protein AVEN_15090-1 [Araneus ventricosus]